MLGYAMCGSFCNLRKAIDQLRNLAASGEEILPIMSQNTYYTDTKFGKAKDFVKEVEEICGKKIIKEIPEAEPIGPQIKLDCLCIAPCTGNTLAKMAHGICDTSVTMAAKAHLRNERPLVIALASNDVLSLNAPSLAIMLQRKNVYIVPFEQDDALKKPRSAVCRFELIADTINEAKQGRQIQPILWCDGGCGL